MKTTLKIEGLHCPNCARNLQSELCKIKDVSDLSIDVVKGEMSFDSKNEKIAISGITGKNDGQTIRLNNITEEYGDIIGVKITLSSNIRVVTHRHVLGTLMALGIKRETIGDILLDGKGLGDVNNAVIRDRELLAESGVLMVVANINAKTRKVLSGPKFVSKGFYYDDEDETKMNEIFDKIKEKMFTGKFINWVEFKNEVKTEISKYVYKKTKTNPIIIPVIISTEPDSK